MTWTTIFLVCFWLGFLLSAVSWLLGAFLPRLPHVPHFGHGAHGPHAAHASHAPHARGGHMRGGGQPSAPNFSTATAFLGLFGGAGYLLTRYTTVSPCSRWGPPRCRQRRRLGRVLVHGEGALVAE